MRKLLALSLSLVACGGASKDAKDPMTADHDAHHGHDHGAHDFHDAASWSKVFDDPARDAWQKPAVVVDVLDARPGMTVADVGAGTGYFEPWLARAVGVKGSVLAVDVEPGMVRHLEARATNERLTNVKASLGKPDDPGLPPQGVDRILIVDTWHHIEDRAGYANKLVAALRPGGRIVIVDFKPDAPHGPPPAMRLPADRVASELVATGALTATVDDRSLPDQYLVVATWTDAAHGQALTKP